MTALRGMSLRERQKMQTRDHILDVAGTLFGEKGFASTSINDVVEVAGTSRATLYAHFESKDSLLEALLDRMWTESQWHYEKFGALDDWTRGSILGWLRNFARAWQRYAMPHKAAMAAMPSFQEEAPARHRQQVEAVRRNKELWRDFPDLEADLRASMVINAVQFEFFWHFYAEPTIDLDVLLGYLTDGVRALLKAA
ncbi:helix-turn-helix domain-containing protein [Rhodococcus sp. IEGM 1366]|uniref:TetR/AcrR family transcriptional regulator n=1 Tax=Rhodococcus sp. IEGM 1366 TaxID=3082223 RepID=UPI0029554AD5|nr:helix-turn-helix domain-containing protein [Rhodococcus sp. IEGM 1366]MDV8071338.1 helix-turn-helix domain-containing protein [Rhodococcus sp. IEGM 1366]